MTDERTTDETARVSVSVAVPLAVAFEIFTRDIDRWWRRGVKFRHAGRRAGLDWKAARSTA
jgi:hypothetical protein